MRIIAGEFRGRRLAAPAGLGTRPMLDRVREALFSTLADAVPGAAVLDLFAGTGSLGLEALSRGAACARFCERDRGALEALRANVASLGLGDRVEIVPGDALRPEVWPEDPVDLVLIDPPYPLLRERRGRRRLLDAAAALFDRHLAPGGALVLHAHPRDLRAADFAPREALERTYGRTALWYLWKLDQAR